MSRCLPNSPCGRKIQTGTSAKNPQYLSLLDTRSGCYAGRCGTCGIFFNGHLVYSCLIAAFAAQNAKVLTLEGIIGRPLFQDITAGFKRANYQPCRSCYQSKLLSLYALFEESPVPDRFAIEKALLGRECKCLDMSSFMQAVSLIIDETRSRADVRHSI